MPKSIGRLLPASCRHKATERRGFLAIELQSLCAGILRGVAQHGEKLGGAISERQRPLLQQGSIFQDLCTDHQLKAITVEIYLSSVSKTGSRGMLAHMFTSYYG